MTENIKEYDAILTHGARWLCYFVTDKLEKDQKICIKDEPLSNNFKCFLEIVKVFHTYIETDIYINCSLIKFLYLKYILKFKFLKQLRKIKVKYINPTDFLTELAAAFEKDISIFSILYKAYYGGKR